MTHIKNKKVLISGGLSGIGKLMGEMVLQRGGELVIWDHLQNHGTFYRKKRISYERYYE